MTSPVTLVLGGARSGKSRYGESLVTGFAPPWIYLATATAGDEEMQARIVRHQARRGEGWRTLERPIDMPAALMTEPAIPALVDCLTLWLTNLMMTGTDIPAAVGALEQALDVRQAPSVLVANEVGLGLVPETPLGRAFRDEAGLLNQRVAARADRVVLVVAGLPLVVK